MWTYLYRAVDRNGQTLNFMLSERRDLAAARRFFKQAIGTNGVPDRVVIDKSGANLAGLQSVNVILKFTGTGRLVTIRQVKYLDNILEQDHRFIKRITGPMVTGAKLRATWPAMRLRRCVYCSFKLRGSVGGRFGEGMARAGLR